MVAEIVSHLIEMRTRPNVSPQDILSVLHHLTNRFTSLCLDESWPRKSAGCSGVRIMLNAPDLAQKWVSDREMEPIRTLTYVLKDLPHDLPRGVDEVIDILVGILRLCNSNLDFTGDGATHARNKLVHLGGMFCVELQSPNPIIREASQRCIAFLAELSGRSPSELLVPHRDRMLAGIYTKPLRALPFSKQIGMIEAIRYYIQLDPPIVELNEELLRLLHETLALADAADEQLMGPRVARQNQLEIQKLRVACIKLLTAAMPITDFFSRLPATRQRYAHVT